MALQENKEISKEAEFFSAANVVGWIESVPDPTAAAAYPAEAFCGFFAAALSRDARSQGTPPHHQVMDLVQRVMKLGGLCKYNVDLHAALESVVIDEGKLSELTDAQLMTGDQHGKGTGTGVLEDGGRFGARASKWLIDENGPKCETGQGDRSGCWETDTEPETSNQPPLARLNYLLAKDDEWKEEDVRKPGNIASPKRIVWDYMDEKNGRDVNGKRKGDNGQPLGQWLAEKAAGDKSNFDTGAAIIKTLAPFVTYVGAPISKFDYEGLRQWTDDFGGGVGYDGESVATKQIEYTPALKLAYELLWERWRVAVNAPVDCRQ